MCKKLHNKIVATIIILIALGLAIAVNIRNQYTLNLVIFIHKFFEVMIPILAVGALLKYIICGSCGCNHDDHSCKKN